MLPLYAVLLTLFPLALAKNDLSGCTSSETVDYGGASLIWYVPGTGEICSFLDCGGGAGAPITTQPGCPLYSGTASYIPSYLPGYGGASTMATATASASGHGSSGSGSQTDNNNNNNIARIDWGLHGDGIDEHGECCDECPVEHWYWY